MNLSVLARSRVACWFAAAVLLSGTGAAAGESFVAFESGQVRPLALSGDGARLLATNTPDGRLEVFDVTESGLVHAGSVPVGLEPVAVAARSANEAWVVNHLSDSVSIVDLSGTPDSWHVTTTLAVGDEPRDIVLAGKNNGRAFVTTAHRGQNMPGTFDQHSEGGRADVWVFDADAAAAGLGGLVSIVNLFGDVPRPLAVDPTGGTVYAGILHSGNVTTLVGPGTVNGSGLPPFTDVDGAPAPETSLVVRFNGTDWLDAGGRVWTDQVRISLPDYDVFAIDANAAIPQVTERYSGVGTNLFNIAVNPASGLVYVSNTEALNHNRFEGHGNFGGSTLRGHFIENRITVISPTTQLVSPRHLNKHIDYSTLPGTAEENANSLATPVDMAISSDGLTLYVAAFGSAKVGIFETQALESDSFVPDDADHIELSGGGPSGVILDEAHDRLYVMTRFDNAVSVIDLEARAEAAHLSLYNPEPASLVAGRPFLYDARFSSSRGDSSCAGCHIFGDTDHLSWDLGNPDGSVAINPNPFKFEPPAEFRDFHPMKGAMGTQSLRGMDKHGPLHWRGDKTGGDDPGGSPFDEAAGFRKFNGAFVELLGRSAELSENEMQAFTEFAMQLTYPPNPVRALDNSLTATQAAGEDLYFNFPVTEDGTTCNSCHRITPALGLFGTGGESMVRFAGETGQPMKVPHLRNLYTKVGFLRQSLPGAPPGSPLPAIRGYGFTHDASVQSVTRVLRIFDAIETDEQRNALAEYLMATPSNVAPIVGQQATVGDGNPATGLSTAYLMTERADVRSPQPECDLVARGVVNGQPRGFLRVKGGKFKGDKSGERLYTLGNLVTWATEPGQAFTFTCVPPGSGYRMALDRNEDGVLDND
ncbi:MAG: hypothetical protein AAFN78_17715 [Pseudomonadota bacterium]